MKSVSVHKDFFRQIRKHSPEDIGLFFLALAAEVDGGECPELPATLEMLKEMISDQNSKHNEQYERKAIRDSAEYRLWRISVFKRDHFTCQRCKKWGGDIHAHHIKRFLSNPESRLNVDNGVTLCKKCHRELHGMEG